LVDFEAGLNTAVRKLRDALGDHSEQPRYVETVPRRGYRFVAPVVALASAAPVLAEVTGDLPGRARTRWRQFGTAAGALLAVLAVALTVATRGTRPTRLRLLILPLAAAEADRALAAVVSEDLITHLGRVDPAALEVVGPVTARSYRDSDQSAQQIGRELGATHVLAGRIAGEPSRLRLTVHLSRTHDGVQEWGEMLDAPAASPEAAVPGLVARAARATASRLGIDDPRVLARAGTLSTAAFELYVRGRAGWRWFDRRALEASLADLRAAAESDPAFVEALVGVAEAHAFLGLGGHSPRAASFAASMAAARAALVQVPDDPEAHAILGFSLFYSLEDWRAAETELERAVELDPGRALAHQWIAAFLVASGRAEEGLEHARRAARLEPRSPAATSDLCLYLNMARQFAAAREWAERAALQVEGPGPALCAELVARQLGDERGEAEAFFERLRRSGESAERIAVHRQAMEQGGIEQLRRRQIAEIGLTEGPTGRSAYRLAAALVAVGDRAEAIRTLVGAAADPPWWWAFLGVDPSFDPLRGEPAFQTLLASHPFHDAVQAGR
jgi:TolB-like protein/Tfp pilus assembly protein PilF